MATATRQCDECQHFYYHVGADLRECLKGHKPRFYKQHWCDSNTSWGWKRKCEDFKETNRGPDRLD